MEANYKIQLGRNWAVRPDLQYVINPGGDTGGKDALVAGFQLEFSH